MVSHKAFESCCISSLDYPCTDLASLTVFDASHNSLTYGTTSC